MRARPVLWALALVAGCGRVGFTDHAIGDDAPSADDAPPVDAAPLATCVRQLTAGGEDSCALLVDGTILCWGQNGAGQLGDGTTSDRATPIPVRARGGDAFDHVTQISAGVESTTCARRDDATAWCWGQNDSGQLGDGKTNDANAPTQVLAGDGHPFTDVAVIETGEHHTCAVRTDGTVWCWGRDDRGQLGGGGGGGSGSQSLAPVEVILSTSAPLTGVTGVMVGFQHTCAWTAAGAMACWGANNSGQLGDGTTLDRAAPVSIEIANVRAAASAFEFTCALAGSGVACTGDGGNGALGDGTTSSRVRPVPTLASAGTPFTDATAIGAGDQTACALRGDGTVWCWGDGGGGQLGDGTSNRATFPTRAVLPATAIELAVGNSHACALLADATIHCWGNDQYGQLGDGSSATSLAPTTAQFSCPP